MLKDELQALQMAYTSLEVKFGKVQEENRELVSAIQNICQCRFCKRSLGLHCPLLPFFTELYVVIAGDISP